MIVLKIGGDVFKKGLDSRLAADIKTVLEADRLVIIHGGGDEVTRVAEKLGKRQNFVLSPGGIKSRYTDKETAEIYVMVMAGKLNKAIVAFLLSEGVQAFGLSGIDAALLKAKRKERLLTVDERGKKRIIDGGFTGKITQVNTMPLNLLIESGYVPVISPVAISEANELLNVDSDRAAAQIAGALKADKVIFLTDVQGIFQGETFIEKLSVKEAEQLLPKLGTGMNMKIIASVEALKAGVKEVIIASGLAENPLVDALKRRTGTVITLE